MNPRPGRQGFWLNLWVCHQSMSIWLTSPCHQRALMFHAGWATLIGVHVKLPIFLKEILQTLWASDLKISEDQIHLLQLQNSLFLDADFENQKDTITAADRNGLYSWWDAPGTCQATSQGKAQVDSAPPLPPRPLPTPEIMHYLFTRLLDAVSESYLSNEC